MALSRLPINSLRLLNDLLFALLFTLFSILADDGARAQPAEFEQPTAQIDVAPEELDALISRLEDPVAREALLNDLRALRTASQPAASDEPAPTIPFIDRQIDQLAQMALRAGNWISRLPNVRAWLEFQISDPGRLAFWRQLAIELAATLGSGIVIAGLVRHLWDRRDPGPKANVWTHLRFALTREVFSILALLIAFGIASIWFKSSAHLLPLIQKFATAIIAFRAVKLVTKLLYAPNRPEARLLPIANDTATLAHNWTNRAAFVFVLAFIIPVVALDLTMPPLIHHVLQHIAYVCLVVIGTIGLFRALPALVSELVPEANGRLRYWLGDRGPVIGMLVLIASYVIWSLGFPGGAAFLVRAIVGTGLVILAIFVALRWIQPAQAAIESLPADDDDDEGDGDGIGEQLKSRYSSFIPTILKAVIFLAGGIALSELWNLGIAGWLWSDSGTAVTTTLLRIAIVGLLALTLAELASHLASRYIKAVDPLGRPQHSNRNRTLATFFRNIMLFALAVFSIVFVLGQLGVDATALLAGAGVVGLAIGFGSQKLVQDLINSLFILFGDTIRVGDVVELGDRAGVVEAMSMRTVTLRGYNGNVHTVPYSSIDSITNMTKDFSYADFSIGIGYGENVDEVADVLIAIFKEMRRERSLRREILGDIEMAGVDELGDSAVVIKGRIKTQPGSQWGIRREFTRRVKLRFDELGIDIPFPQRTVHVMGGTVPAVQAGQD